MKPYQQALLFVLAFAVIECALIAYADQPISLYMRQMDVSHHGVVDFFRSITDAGLGKWYLWSSVFGAVVCAILLRTQSLKPKTRERIRIIGEALLFLFICVALSGIITDILKILFGRGRPVILERENLYAFHPLALHNNWKSMPSGHTTTIIAVMCALIILIPRGRWIWIAVALTIAVSRIFVNAHYLSDVLAGAIVGSATVILVTRYRGHKKYHSIKSRFFP